ncbi:hypothetical protein KKH15_02050 [Patescibacteria group bacterium]|nr:hypothetical protein [Patescibacteria group bacterium]MBU1755229.1 hypothetical protein [Patescibacteria group bacterium]
MTCIQDFGIKYTSLDEGVHLMKRLISVTKHMLALAWTLCWSYTLYHGLASGVKASPTIKPTLNDMIPIEYVGGSVMVLAFVVTVYYLIYNFDKLEPTSA